MFARITVAVGIIVAMVATFARAPLPASAEVTIAVFPALMDLKAPAGATGQQTITFSNDGDEPVAGTVAVNAVAGLDASHSAADWITLSADSAQLAPGEKLDVVASIAVPDDTPSGGYYAQVTLSTDAPDAGSNAGAVSGSISNGIMITVDGDGDIVRSETIDHVAPIIEADGRIGFRAQVTNSGNVHLLEPSGLIQVLNEDESPLGSLEILPTTPLLPGRTQLFGTQGSLPLTPGTTYKAQVSLTYLNAEKPVTSEFTFTVASDLAVDNLAICENLDRGPSITLSLRNNGTVALQPGIAVSVSDPSRELGQAAPDQSRLIWPGEAVDVAIDYPQRLESGTYSLTATIAADPTGQPIVQALPFQIGGLSGTPIPVCSS
jgi:hypothetical protein